MFKILVLFPRFMYQVLEKVLELGARSQERSQVQFLSSRKCTRFRTQVVNLGPKSQKMSQIQVLRPGSGPRIRTYVLEKALDLGLRSQIQVPGPRSQVLGPRFRPISWKMSQDLRSQDCVLLEMSQIQVLLRRKGPRFQKRSQIQDYVLVNLLDLKCPRFRPRSQKSPGPRNVLDLDLGLLFLHFCPTSQ